MIMIVMPKPIAGAASGSIYPSSSLNINQHQHNRIEEQWKKMEKNKLGGPDMTREKYYRVNILFIYCLSSLSILSQCAWPLRQDLATARQASFHFSEHNGARIVLQRSRTRPVSWF